MSILYFLIKSLRKHPGKLFLLEYLSEIVMITHYFFLSLNKNDNILNSSACTIIASYTVFTYYFEWFTILFLCSENLIILRLKLYKTAGIRMNIYILLAVLLSSSLLITYSFTDSLGLSVYSTCFIKEKSLGEHIDIFILLFFSVSILISVIIIRRQIDCYTYKTFQHYSKVLLLVVISAIINRALTLSLFIQSQYGRKPDEEELFIGIIFAIIRSSIVSFAQIFHPKVINSLRKFLARIKEKNLSKKRIASEDELLKSIIAPPEFMEVEDISDIFEKLGYRIIVQILIVLTLKFKTLDNKYNSLSKEIQYRWKKTRTKFEQSYFNDLSVEYNMPFIKNYFCPKFEISEYEKDIFTAIRKAINFTNEKMLNSLISYESVKSLVTFKNKGGRSESFFFRSVNHMIIIKTISSGEMKSFLEFLPRYSKRIIENPQSKLIRILGVYRVYPNKQDFIIMENSLGNYKESVIFDIKGSTVDREVKGIDMNNPPFGFVLKDLNFTEYNRKISVQNSKELIKNILNDLKVLRNDKLMDYSLLIGFHENPVNNRYSVDSKITISIIDFFQRYDFNKSAESFWKRRLLRKDSDISAISPKRYYNRLKKVLPEIIIDSN